MPDNAYFDGKLAEKSMEDLKKLKARNQPFFLAVGFYKPHLPFNAPQKYWDLYPLEKIRLPDNPHPPKDAPEQAIHEFGELRAYFDIPTEGPVRESFARKLIQGYYAATSYMDAQVGRLLETLEELDLDDNTIVILLGDHGWNLLEHGLWCKHSNFRTSLRTTLIARGPGIAGGGKADGLVELIDLYPTLCELTGLPLPDHLDGSSLVPILEDPAAPGKPRVIAKWYDGYTFKTDRYAYTEWRNRDSIVYARMLYDHQTDLDENVNISETEEGQEIIRRVFGGE